METVYTLQEIADLLKVHVKTVRRAVDKKELAVFYIGDSPRVKESELNKYIENRRSR